jgi:hypothetical protein
MSVPKSRIMYIERKAESLNGPARIGRVALSKTGRTVEYRGQNFRSLRAATSGITSMSRRAIIIGFQAREKMAKTACILKVPSPLRSMKTFAKNTGQRFVACLSAARPEIKLTHYRPQQKLDGVSKVSDG